MSAARDVAMLREILVNAVDLYLTLDNPESTATGTLAKAAAAVVSLYHNAGKAGRVRAKSYKSAIEDSKESINALFVRVIDEIQNTNSCLGSSVKLRGRLLQGLCDFFAFTDEQIQVNIQAIRDSHKSSMQHASSYAYQCTLPSDNILYANAIMNLLKVHLVKARRELAFENQRARVVSGTVDGHENRSLIGNHSL